MVGGGDAPPVVDAEVIEPELDRNDSFHPSNAEPTSKAGRRTYTLSDFER